IELCILCNFVFFFQAEDGIRDFHVTGVQTCALPIFRQRERQRSRIGGQRRGALRAVGLLRRPSLLGRVPLLGGFEFVGQGVVGLLAGRRREVGEQLRREQRPGLGAQIVQEAPDVGGQR